MEVDFKKCDGLVTAVVQDAGTLDVLMVAYMSPESLQVTIETGLATFWSRSKGKLWMKGMGSGNFLHVKEIRLDCDSDALLVMVSPDGPACHTGAVSCFFEPDGKGRVIAGPAESSGLDRVTYPAQLT